MCVQVLCSSLSTGPTEFVARGEVVRFSAPSVSNENSDIVGSGTSSSTGSTASGSFLAIGEVSRAPLM